jgi:hypothetical protein
MYQQSSSITKLPRKTMLSEQTNHMAFLLTCLAFSALLLTVKSQNMGLHSSCKRLINKLKYNIAEVIAASHFVTCAQRLKTDMLVPQK